MEARGLSASRSSTTPGLAKAARIIAPSGRNILDWKSRDRRRSSGLDISCLHCAGCRISSDPSFFRLPRFAVGNETRLGECVVDMMAG